MAEPVPVRGLAEVSDIERILRPQNDAMNFKYNESSSPTRQQVCDEIDAAYDELALDMDTWGIKNPPTNEKTIRVVKVLNAYLAASNIENQTHSSSEPNTTTYGDTLKKIYEEKRDRFLEKTIIPVEDRTNERPMIHMSDSMAGTMSELYDTSKYDTINRESYFRMSKKF